MNLVEIRDLRRRLGGFSLEVPAWDVPAGAVVGVVGPNGAGKTTLLRLIPGLDRPDGGTVRVLGLDPWREPVEVRARVGFASDDQGVFALRIDHLLHVISGYYPSWDAAFAEALLARFAVDPKMTAQRLSRGEGTRLRLVLAMAFHPRLLVLDEPTAGLDLGGRRALLASVLEVVKDEAGAVIVSTHQLADIERIADRLLVLDRGRVVREGPTQELVRDDQTLEEALVAWRVL